MSESIVIVGAGIVGSALAYFLSQSPKRYNITIIDRSFESLLGSTGIAPGFVGQYNESDVLTRLAIQSVSEYVKIPGGLDRVGGLEIAFQPAGIERLKSRCEDAKRLGLSAKMLSIEEARSLAPELIKESEGAALLFPSDGTANAVKIASWYQDEARKQGVMFIEADVQTILLQGHVRGIEILENGISRQLNADKVILTTGLWAQELATKLDFPVPVIPVGHPYMHGQIRDPLAHKLTFVRWPEHHVYARDHGSNFGIGSYDHESVAHKPPNGTATGDWFDKFDEPLNFARSLLPTPTAEEFKYGKHFNGVFSMTPDNMPLAGKVNSVEGLYMAVAVWITHAAGSAKFLTSLLDGEDVDVKTREALDPERFRGQDFKELEKKSLLGYNSIYKTVKAELV
ncbi:hypothetical protein FGRMN_4501 [Fusarium graminum]|nr:hypothetical protein FGRMN_4501 [Fusarium graminum]